MKPFNLEAAMRGEPLVTRDGRKAKFVAYVPEADEGYRLLVFVEGDCSASEYWDSGTWYPSHETDEDILMVDYAGMELAGIEFPEPLRNAPAKDQEIWLVDITGIGPVKLNWEAIDLKNAWLKSGLIQATKEGAELQLRAMIKSVGGTYE